MESIKRLDMNNDFDWDGKEREAETDNSSDEEGLKGIFNGVKHKVKKKEADIEEASNEHIIGFDSTSYDYQDLSTLNECESLVISYPNSSKAWLLYMVFHLKQAEVDKARSVAERALKTISFRDEKEKFNIWIALLNLENLYGTRTSLMDVFQRAVTYNEPKDVFNHLADLYMASGKLEDAELLLEVMVKKFKQDKDIWMKYGLVCYTAGKKELARKIMERSFMSLEKKFRPDVIGKFAYMEYKWGDPERGKTMFRNLVENYPKRKDLLVIYIAMLEKCQDKEELASVSSLLQTKEKR